MPAVIFHRARCHHMGPAKTRVPRVNVGPAGSRNGSHASHGAPALTATDLQAISSWAPIRRVRHHTQRRHPFNLLNLSFLKFLYPDNQPTNLGPLAETKRSCFLHPHYFRAVITVSLDRVDTRIKVLPFLAQQICTASWGILFGGYTA